MNKTTSTIYGRLTELRAADVMNRDVVTVDGSLTMEEAARRMADRGVTSTPVVDELGRCIGMLSASDFLMREVPAEKARVGPARDEADYVMVHQRADSVHIERVERRGVQSYMSAGVQAIPSDTPLPDVARVMCASHLHRLPVLDGNGRPIGVVSSLDLVAAMLNAIEEQRQLAKGNGR